MSDVLILASFANLPTKLPLGLYKTTASARSTMVSFTSIAAILLAAATVVTAQNGAGASIDCDCTTLNDNGDIIPDDAGVRAGCAGRGSLVTRDGDLKCVIIEDGTPEHTRARDFLRSCSLHGRCGFLSQ
ncbi:hypothetical protein LX36DRAFT_752330 [Colletotrichum falcatum]|nr:hypothetical protein LX36DRAFT_752330 [Colletotrichum falcatum]